MFLVLRGDRDRMCIMHGRTVYLESSKAPGHAAGIVDGQVATRRARIDTRGSKLREIFRRVVLVHASHAGSRNSVVEMTRFPAVEDDPRELLLTPCLMLSFASALAKTNL